MFYRVLYDHVLHEAIFWSKNFATDKYLLQNENAIKNEILEYIANCMREQIAQDYFWNRKFRKI